MVTQFHHKYMRGLTQLVGLTLMVGLIGCKTTSRNLEAEALKFAAPVEMAQQTAPAPKTEGSLWQEDAPLNDMFSSAKARKVGDIITVRIVESAKAKNKADTNTERKSSCRRGLPIFSILNRNFRAPARISIRLPA